ncbi:4Fe-4S binding protein [Cellulosilyticum sp. I15G10I2]|uniref:4Fe-4S binding protein n=1 Tax=Cellulosilyticum sp. I15G10I2 TaxID=1892843 RepID=UPI00085C59B0|nr:4Fe-4S binding protein [Cellulosilyticum sp. I15G10I2]
MTKKRKSHQKWSWIFMIAFILLSIIDFRFGILGIICMTTPMVLALRGAGKAHCSYYCPRGSLLGRFLQNISFQHNLPKWAKSNRIKNILLIIMISMLTLGMIHANREGFNLMQTGFTLFRFMTVSLGVGVIMGVIFKPRSWCQVCPMGHGTALIDKSLKSRKS